MKFTKWVFGIAIKKALEEISARLHLGLSLENEVVKFGDDIIDRMSFSNLDDNLPEILTNAIHLNIQAFLSRFYGQFIGLFCLFLLIPFIEVVIYFRWFAKRIQPPSATSQLDND